PGRTPRRSATPRGIFHRRRDTCMLTTADRTAVGRSFVANFTPVASLLGGLLSGAASVWLLAANGRVAGISGILHGLFAQPPGDRSWRLLFITGLIAAGFAWHLYAGPAPAREGFGLGWAAAAGLLVGLGTR